MKRDCRSGKHYLGNRVCHGVLRVSCFLWDRGDEEVSQDGRAEHLSQGQSPSISNRAGEGTAEMPQPWASGTSMGMGMGMKPVWDIGLQLGVRIQIREEDQSQPQPGMSMQGDRDGGICY